MESTRLFLQCITSIFLLTSIVHGYSRPKNLENDGVHFVIVIPSYNNKRWYEKNLDSVFMQTYHNYDVVYIDDCSADGTADLVKDYIKKHGAQQTVLLVSNEKRNGALANIYNAVHSCKDDDVIV